MAETEEDATTVEEEDEQSSETKRIEHPFSMENVIRILHDFHDIDLAFDNDSKFGNGDTIIAVHRGRRDLAGPLSQVGWFVEGVREPYDSLYVTKIQRREEKFEPTEV